MGKTKELFEEIMWQDYNNEFFDKKIFYETLDAINDHDEYI